MRLFSVALPLVLLAAGIVTMTDAQVAALDAAAAKACRAFVSQQYPEPVQTKVAGRTRTFGSDRDHDQHYGVVVDVTGGDMWMCLYDRDKNAVAFAGIIDKGP